jgi:hydrogenase nickel incorporation protein HypA/HybF
MHELSLARNIIEIVERNIPAEEKAPVRSVRLKVGRMSGVVASSLEFCFEALTSGTQLGGASLLIDEVPLTARCGDCGRTSAMSFPFAECPACGGTKTMLVSGTELEIVDVELDDTEEGDR